MNHLSAFLHPTHTEETIEVVISDRFLDENGEPVKFKLKAISPEKLNMIQKRSTRTNKRGEQSIDNQQCLNRCIVEACIEPDFKNKELCEHYGTIDPVDLPQKMLLLREYQKLATAFIELNGLDDGSFAIDEVTKK